SIYWPRISVAYQAAAATPAPQAPAAKPQPTAGGLRIIALERQRAANVISLHTGTAPVVTVLDDNDRPVDGASVTFSLPTASAGATFGGKFTYTTLTDGRGQAGAEGYEITDRPGRFEIQVTATWQNLTGRLTLTQTNFMAPEEARKALIPSRSIW